jgi:cyclophilin family peptidyl-prolyl cis-trans isomerase
MNVSNGGAIAGSMVFTLAPDKTPITVDNFLAYVNSGFYRNTIYHRVVAGFVAQAGGFTTGPTPKPPTRPPITLESANGLKNLQYTIAMARTSDPNSATSQFFFNLVDNPGLDFGSAENPDGYAVFGRVVSGQDVIDEIGKVETRLDAGSGQANLPVTDVVITAASQTR